MFVRLVRPWQEARLELWEELRETLLEEVEGVNPAHLDDVARRLDLLRGGRDVER